MTDNLESEKNREQESEAPATLDKIAEYLPDETDQQEDSAAELPIYPLFFIVFLVALCGIVYELIIGTCSSYLLGDSVYQFSMTIGLYLSAMGLGSYLSKKVERRLINTLFTVEIAIGLAGGFSGVFLLAAYTSTDFYYPIMILLITLIGAMAGFEIPILVRILEKRESLRETLANVLTFDYVGALIGSLAFPLIVLPNLGVVKGAIAVGLLNIVAAILTLIFCRKAMGDIMKLTVGALLVGAGLVFAFVKADQVTNILESRLFNHRVVFKAHTRYQKLDMTRWNNDIRLYINNHMQFCSVDEYRYHEALVHPAMSLARGSESVLILGGGDGLAARELLKYPDLKEITLVDIDPDIVRLCRENPLINQLNKGSLADPRVHVVSMDAFKFIENQAKQYDCILIDLPDPNNVSLSKLYTVTFYRMVLSRLKPDGALAIQSTSTYFAPKSFWCINKTMAEAGFSVRGYHATVPSFGDWGFQLAAHSDFDPSSLRVKVPTRYLDDRELANLFVMAQDEKLDMEKLASNTLIFPKVLQYYAKEWKKW